MLTDVHCHVLPKIDDGSESTEMSVNMLNTMAEQGVARVVLTSHFYAHRAGSVEHFLHKRAAAFASLKEHDLPIRDLRLGAEVAIEKGISEMDRIAELAIEGTDLILLELPYKPFSDWMLEEIESIRTMYHLTPIVAHIHRYLQHYSKDDYEKVLQADAIFQVNNEAFGSFRESRFVKKLLKNGYPILFGSDSHKDSGQRCPNWDLLKKKAKEPVIEAAAALFERHIR